MQQAIDFREESEALYQIVKDLSDQELEQTTQFKNWTINDVLAHLHHWNLAADLSLKDEQVFLKWMGSIASHFGKAPLREVEKQTIGDLRGKELVQLWRDYYLEMSDRFENTDPKQRVKWAGPDMSVRSSITARLMETWAHGLAVYDLLGLQRADSDRIKNIAQLGINTFGWTFKNRGEDLPGKAPAVILTSPTVCVKLREGPPLVFAIMEPTDWVEEAQ